MDDDKKAFLKSLPYTHCYVRLNEGVLRVYEDETMQNVKQYHQHPDYAKVLYEYEHDKLALLLNEKRVFVKRDGVSLMLFRHFNFETNHYQIINMSEPTFMYDSETKKTSTIEVENAWQAIASHLYIHQLLQNQQQQLAVKKLLGDNLKQRTQIEQLIEIKDTLLKRYLKLRESKLGRIQIKLWERRS